MKARILVETQIDGITYKPNQVVNFDDKLAKTLAGGPTNPNGVIDITPEAVAYCEDELKVKAVDHPAKKAPEKDPKAPTAI